ncbi:hypothetical protein N566_28445 [Streptomycetaceae bacterium MP113-05]|nr:hypothetical protein N566_28445 [Streptomycetaceae bacterium MP113-05]
MTAPARTGPPRRRDARRPGDRSGAGPRGRTAVRPSPSRWFAEQLVEVLSGRRPVHALLGHARGTAFDQVLGLAERSPLRPDGADRRAAVLASVRSMRVEDDVIEASARITSGGRERAMAFRLEAGEDRRWRCAAVELG